MSNITHRRLTLIDVDQAAQVIAESFVDDLLISYMLPFKATRVKTLVKFFRVYGEINIKNNRGFGAGEPLQGVAFWKYPAQESLSISIKSLGKLLPLLFSMYPIGYFRARKIIEQVDLLHKKYADEPHFYLDNIGVLASARGKGISSELIRPFLKMADDQKVIIYTDTMTTVNVPFYEHFGFQCMEEYPVKGTRLSIYALRRPVQ